MGAIKSVNVWKFVFGRCSVSFGTLHLRDPAVNEAVALTPDASPGRGGA